MSKKIYSREEFEELRIISAEKMAQDKKLQKDALDVLSRADNYYWIHQSTWFGEPVLNLAQDMLAIQEIIFKTRPEYIIELGVAWGGSLLFYATLLEILGGKKVIGVDIFIPDDLKDRLKKHQRIYDRLLLINDSSLEDNTFKKIKSIIGNSKKNLIILDSFHSHEHVIKELKLYSTLIGKDYYLICGDTIIEDLPEHKQKERQRPWGHGNNPKTALEEFLNENKNFIIDKSFDNKLLFSCNINGYLKCIK